MPQFQSLINYKELIFLKNRKSKNHQFKHQKIPIFLNFKKTKKQTSNYNTKKQISFQNVIKDIKIINILSDSRCLESQSILTLI